MKRVLLAGITGYLGSYIAKELQKRAFNIRGIARSTATLSENGIQPDELILAELAQPETIIGCCKNINVVISTIRQRAKKTA